MKRPVMVDARYAKAAREMAATIGLSAGDVVTSVSLAHHFHMIDVIHSAGLGDRKLDFAAIPGLFVQADQSDRGEGRTNTKGQGMTDAQRLQLAAATARKELRALALTDDASAEDIQAASAKVDDLEARSAVLSAAEEAEHGAPKVTGEDAEARERRELRGKGSRGRLRCRRAHWPGHVRVRPPSTADAAGTPGLLPLELLETRAVTPGPSR